MDRIVLHSDANCFYASVEMLYHPEFDGKPLAVGGDPEARHGIVLTANYIAKRKGVKTRMALWQAKQACPDLIVVPPRMDLYLKFSGMLREIYSDYTNQIEPYGCDESWLDVTGSSSLKGDGRKIAEEISRRVKKELGITVSIGISWNKIFAKLGSDYKKPDGITEFNRQNYKDLIWRLPASDLLYVGRSTRRVLTKYGIRTIGELACADPDFLERQLGKMGLVIHSFANGWDDSQVAAEGYSAPIKSIGNSTTAPRDLVTGMIPVQLDLFMDEQRREKQARMDAAVDDIRRRFGYFSIQRAFMYQDKLLSDLDAQGSHTVHPVGYFNGR